MWGHCESISLLYEDLEIFQKIQSKPKRLSGSIKRSGLRRCFWEVEGRCEGIGLVGFIAFNYVFWSKSSSGSNIPTIFKTSWKEVSQKITEANKQIQQKNRFFFQQFLR